MKLNDCLARIDAVKPNAFSDDDKVAWINEIEGQVQTEIHHVALDDVVSYTLPVDRLTELIVKPPHDKLYPLYLTAMIDFANGEYSKYQNGVVMFNAALDEYHKWYMRHNMRPQPDGTGGGATEEGGGSGEGGGTGKPGKDGKDGLSAYEIAVKHGFGGTEEEWLLSLRGANGKDGAPGPVGPQGATGSAGKDGAPGLKGDPGDPGVEAVTQAAYDALAAAGTVDEAIFYFIVPEVAG